MTMKLASMGDTSSVSPLELPPGYGGAVASYPVEPAMRS